VRREVVDRLLHLVGEPLPQAVEAGPVDPPRIGRRHHAHPLGQAVEAHERRRDRRDLGGDAVVRVARHDDARAARVLLGDPQREVVGLRARAGEHHVRQAVGQRGEQVLGVRHDRVVQVARVRREHRGLLGDRGRDPRMRVPDRRHVVVGVEVLHAVCVVELRAGPAHDVQGVAVEEPVRRAEGVDAAAHEVALGRLERVDGARVEVARRPDGAR